MAVGVVAGIFRDVDHVIGKFFLGYEDFFHSVDDEVATGVIAAFAEIESGHGRESI